MYVALCWSILAVTVTGCALAYWGTRDAFHPTLLTMPIFAFLYGWMPLQLQSDNTLFAYFSYDDLVFVQTVNFAGVSAFLIGCLRSAPIQPMVARASEAQPSALLRGAAVLALISLAAWLKTITDVGGLSGAYGAAYGGGWNENGYVRDAVYLSVPAILLVSLALRTVRARKRHYVLIAVCAIPWVLHGALGARRGPTFVICVVLALSFYIMRNRRPAVAAIAAGGVALGYLMLLLVANRSNIFLGSEQKLSTDVSSFYAKADHGNEFVYGSAVLLKARENESYFWGRRYFGYVFVRPIPSVLWPTKYEDLGVPELRLNAGTSGGDLNFAGGWTGAIGAAPGIVADLWIEMSWLGIPALWVLGFAYGIAWRRAIAGPDIWIAQYIIMACLSMYLIMQTIEAFLPRLLELSIPTWAVWMYAKRQGAILRLRQMNRGITYEFPRSCA